MYTQSYFPAYSRIKQQIVSLLTVPVLFQLALHPKIILQAFSQSHPHPPQCLFCLSLLGFLLHLFDVPHCFSSALKHTAPPIQCPSPCIYYISPQRNSLGHIIQLLLRPVMFLVFWVVLLLFQLSGSIKELNYFLHLSRMKGIVIPAHFKEV